MIKKWIEQGEGLTIDFKNSGILSHVDGLARAMTAFANNKYICEPHGGKLLIGVTDNGLIEGVNYDKQHEETIMNVARDKIDPPIIPKFDKIEIDKKTVYVVTIPKTISTIHELRTKGRLTPLIRVGSTIRSPSQNELMQLKETQEKPVEEIEKIESFKNFKIPYSEFYRKIMVTPKNVNSTLLEFDKQVFEYLASLNLSYMNLCYPTLHQNEIHFLRDKTFSNTINLGGLLDNNGNACFLESQCKNKNTEMVWYLQRDIFYLKSVLNFVKTVFKKYNYLGNIQINYDLNPKPQSELNYGPGTFFESRPFDGKMIRIQKITNIDTINIFEIIKSIVAEIDRSFGVPSGAQDLDNYVSSVLDS